MCWANIVARFTQWRRRIGCLILQIFFCKLATNYRALLRTESLSVVSGKNCTTNYRMPYLYRSLSTNEPYSYWLFCRKRPATYASSPPCIITNGSPTPFVIYNTYTGDFHEFLGSENGDGEGSLDCDWLNVEMVMPQTAGRGRSGKVLRSQVFICIVLLRI